MFPTWQTLCTWLVGGLFNELEVELIAESFLLETLLYGQLDHGDTVVCVHLFKTNPTRGCDTCGQKVFPLDGVSCVYARCSPTLK